MSKPLISVIIPAYNVEKYIGKCIESAIAQTYEKIEILVVIDGSKDNSQQIANEYVNKDSRVRVIVKENGGLSSARNAGMAEAVGEYIYFLDSDDYIAKETINDCWEAMEQNNADLVAFSKCNVYESSKKEEDFIFANRMIEIHSEEERLDFLTKKYCLYKFGFEAWNKLYDMKIIKEHNIWFENNYEVFAEDICFNLYYCLFVNKLVVLDKPYYYYMIRDDSIMGMAKKDLKLPNIVELLYRVRKFYEKNNASSYIMENYYKLYSIVLHNRYREFKFYSLEDNLKKIVDSKRLKFFKRMNVEVLKNKDQILDYYNKTDKSFDNYWLGNKIVEETRLAMTSVGKGNYRVESARVFTERSLRKVYYNLFGKR